MTDTWRARRSSRPRSLVLLVALLMAATACGTEDEASTSASADGGSEVSPGDAVAGGELPVTVDHLYGSTEITEAPERVVALSTADADAAAALGLAPVDELLRDEGHFRQLLDLDGAAAHMDPAWAGLAHAVRTGEAGYPEVAGRGFWASLDADPVLAESFDRHLAGWAEEWIPPVVARFDWPTSGRVVDVGGGVGALLTAILRARPGLHGTLVEQPASAERARQARDAGTGDTGTGTGPADRMAVVEGSFFDPLPADGDVYVLAQVLHDWPDDDAVRILGRCADAAGRDGRIVVVERVMDDEAPTDEHVRMDLRMTVLFGSGERTLDEYGALAARAGLEVTSLHPAGQGISCVVLTAR